MFSLKTLYGTDWGDLQLLSFDSKNESSFEKAIRCKPLFWAELLEQQYFNHNCIKSTIFISNNVLFFD